MAENGQETGGDGKVFEIREIRIDERCWQGPLGGLGEAAQRG